MDDPGNGRIVLRIGRPFPEGPEHSWDAEPFREWSTVLEWAIPESNTHSRIEAFSERPHILGTVDPGTKSPFSESGGF